MQEVVQEMVTFAVVIREGSFSAAARSLGKSKGYVSTHIARLEAHLGAKLLYRSTRKIALTKTGAIFLPHCDAVFERLQQAQQSIEDSQEHMSGDIRLTMPMSLGQQSIQTWLLEFKQQYPNIVISLTLSNTPFDLENTTFDLAIRAANQVTNLDYVALHLATFRYGLYASNDYLNQHGTPQHASALSTHQGIIHSEVDENGQWQLTDEAGAVSAIPNVSCAFNSAEACQQAAVCGLGIARLPNYLAHQTSLHRVLPELSSEPIAVQLIYPYQGQQAKRVRALIDFLKAKRELGALSLSAD